jgi:rhodanese-related sulfurtransferase
MNALAQQARRLLGQDIAIVLGTVIAAGVLAVGLNALRPDPLPLTAPAPDLLLARAVGRPVNPAAPPRAVTLAEVAATDGRTVLLDAREEPIFELGHLPGARNLSRADFAAQLAALALAPDTPVIVYCSDAECPDSEVVAGALTRLGFRDVAVFRGGWAEWEASGR